MAKRETVTDKPWRDQTATAGQIARIIADVLDTEDELDAETLETVANAMCKAFNFSHEEAEAFVLLALVNQEPIDPDDNEG